MFWDKALDPWSLPHNAWPFLHTRSKIKSLRGRRGWVLLPPSCQLHIGLRSHCGDQKNHLFLNESVWVRRKHKNTAICGKWSSAHENIAAFFFLNIGFYKQSNDLLRHPFPSFPQCHMEWKDWSGKKKTKHLNLKLKFYYLSIILFLQPTTRWLVWMWMK